MSRAGLCGLNFFCKPSKTPVFNICLVLKKNPVRDALKRNHSLYILCKIAMQKFGYKFRWNGLSSLCPFQCEQSIRGRPFNSWGEGWVISGHQEFFFLAIWWAGYFFLFFSHKLSITFVLHAIFFLPTSACRKFFFKITNPLPQKLNGRPLSFPATGYS